jgi:hypothetical protein
MQMEQKMKFEEVFPHQPVIGMVHLKALPGSPGYSGDMEEVIQFALADAQALEKGGVDGIMIENFFDVPFFPDNVEPVTVSAMTRVIVAIREKTKLPLGINVLRNDGISALSIAHVCGCQFIRINILSGAMITDQGIIQGKAAEISRLRKRFNSNILIFADCLVKHATPLGQPDILQAAEDTWKRAGADALILSGSGTGKTTDFNQIKAVKQHLPDAPVLVGSGVNEKNIGTILNIADGVIVGSSLKQGNVISNRVDRHKVEALIQKKKKM